MAGLAIRRQPGARRAPTIGPWARVRGPVAPAPAAAAQPRAPFVQPPIPVGAYDPTRDIELNRGKESLNNTLNNLGTSEAHGADDYTLATQAVSRRQQQETENRDTALKQLSESYKRLGVRQGEAASGAGLLTGGALLQAAAKRSSNEAKAQEPINTTYSRQQQQDNVDLANLALQRQRQAEGNQTTGREAEGEQTQFGLDTETLKAAEASKNGYLSPLEQALANSRHPAAIAHRVRAAVHPHANYLAAGRRKARI